MATISFVSGGNPAALPFNFFSLDKLVHLLVFGLVATAFFRVNQHWPAGLRMIIAISATSLFGLLDELHQSATPGRTMDFADWTADTLGAVLAVVAYRAWPRYRRCLELAVWPRPRKNLSP